MSDNDTAIMVAMIVSTASLVGAVITAITVIINTLLTRQNGKKVSETHDLVNSRMTQFMEALKAEQDARVGKATSDGILAGEQSQRERTKKA